MFSPVLIDLGASERESGACDAARPLWLKEESMYLRVGTLAFALLVFSVSSSSAQMSDDDYNGALRAAAAMGDTAARYETCGVDAHTIPEALSHHLDLCQASVSQNSDVIARFLSAKVASRHKYLGAQCPWEASEAQANFDDMMVQIKAMTDKGC